MAEANTLKPDLYVIESPTLIGSSVPLVKDLCIAQATEVQFLTEVMYRSFEVSMPPAEMTTFPLVLIGAPVVFKIRSATPPELDLTKLVLFPLPTVCWHKTLSQVAGATAAESWSQCWNEVHY